VYRIWRSLAREDVLRHDNSLIGLFVPLLPKPLERHEELVRRPMRWPDALARASLVQCVCRERAFGYVSWHDLDHADAILVQSRPGRLPGRDTSYRWPHFVACAAVPTWRKFEETLVEDSTLAASNTGDLGAARGSSEWIVHEGVAEGCDGYEASAKRAKCPASAPKLRQSRFNCKNLG
jgi:hypothetical protein